MHLPNTFLGGNMLIYFVGLIQIGSFSPPLVVLHSVPSFSFLSSHAKDVEEVQECNFILPFRKKNGEQNCTVRKGKAHKEVECWDGAKEHKFRSQFNCMDASLELHSKMQNFGNPC